MYFQIKVYSFLLLVEVVETCAMCECHVDSGGGDVLPTEMNHLTRKEAAENKRLACQVKVREDMEIRIPEEIFGIKKMGV